MTSDRNWSKGSGVSGQQVRIWLALLCSFFLPGALQAQEGAPEDEHVAQMIAQAVWAQNRLWLVHDDGRLVSLAVDEQAPRPEQVTGTVIDACRSGNKLVLLLRQDNVWVVSEHGATGWSILRQGHTSDDPFALACSSSSDDVVVAARKALLTVRGAGAPATRLRGPKWRRLGVLRTLLTDDAVWIGSNVGEWGGGLRRIDRQSGRVRVVERNASGQLCGGPLNTDCDPVTGLANSPGRPGCIVAAIGLVHMLSHGRLVEVCGGAVTTRFVKAHPEYERWKKAGRSADAEPTITIPFFSMVGIGDEIVAVGSDGIYRLAGVGAPAVAPLPDLEERGGYRLSFDTPGVVLILTSVNGRVSLSGGALFLAAR